ncbi:MAG: heavy-metal-associated domain-containing protein, partial [bacterium]|nr:heavy-metal-associated domain-containing protein [bacterium]
MNTQVSIPVTGMTCANCAMNIEKSVKKLSGVSEAGVNFATEAASVVFNANVIGVSDVVGQIKKAGFGVPFANIEFPVTGMTCANCAM